MDGNLAMADVIVNESEETNNFWADVYYCMQERGCRKEEAMELTQPLYLDRNGEGKMNRQKDVEIAINKHGWEWKEVSKDRKMLVPPVTDKRRMWAGIWDESGIPHYLPKYSKGEK